MNPLSSIRAFWSAAWYDRELSRIGSRPGWYLQTFYTGRWDSRFSHRAPSTRLASTEVEVCDRKLEIHLSPQHLGPLRGIFLEEEYNIRPYLPADMTQPRILDLGANVGFSAAYFSALFPGCEIICCEPDPRNVPLLRRTIESNHLNASVVEAAVASKPGILRLRFGDNPTCSALESSPMHDLCDAVEVAVTTVPEVTGSFGWNHIDILKIDIEGTEQELLGRENEWLEHVGVIVMEIHPNTSPGEIGSFLSPYGFQLQRIGFAHEPVYFASRQGERRVNGKDGTTQ